MKPVIIGLGPARSHPADAWHVEALSTSRLCRLINGDSDDWATVRSHFDIIDLNKRWYRALGSLGDSIRVSEAEETLRSLTATGSLRCGRKAFLLGEQVTNFVLEFLRRPASPLATGAWRKLAKCAEHRLRADDSEASIGKARGYYDFVIIPVWHPRTLDSAEARMPPGWQQRMMNVLRAGAGLKQMKFNQGRRPGPQCRAKRVPIYQQSPAG